MTSFNFENLEEAVEGKRLVYEIQEEPETETDSVIANEMYGNFTAEFPLGKFISVLGPVPSVI